MVFAIVIFVVVGAMNAWVGYALKYQRRYGLIAGYDPARHGAPVALAKWLGSGALGLALLCAAGIIAVLALPDRLGLVMRSLGVAVVVTVLVIVSGAYRRRT